VYQLNLIFILALSHWEELDCRVSLSPLTGWNFALAWGIVEIQVFSRSPDGQ
jgi:hypothetical protein